MSKMDKSKKTEKKTEPVNIKLESLDDLKMDGYIMLSDEPVITNKIINILEDKKIAPADLSKMTGISRQNINAVMKGKMKPGIDFALKIAYVLDMKVEEIFQLTQNAWVQTAKSSEESTLYLDIVELRIIDGKTRKDNISKDGLEYYDTVEKKLLVEDEFNKLLEEYIFDKIELAEQDVVEELEDSNKKISDKIIESLAKKKLTSEFENTHVKRYVKLGKKTKPLVNPTKRK